MASNSISAARKTPIIGAFPKMFVPFIVILPGMIAAVLVAPDDKNGLESLDLLLDKLATPAERRSAVRQITSSETTRSELSHAPVNECRSRWPGCASASCRSRAS